MKQIACAKLLAVVACALMLCAVALTPAVADQARHIYDDLWRLHQVIDGQGNVATDTYDCRWVAMQMTGAMG